MLAPAPSVSKKPIFRPSKRSVAAAAGCRLNATWYILSSAIAKRSKHIDPPFRLDLTFGDDDLAPLFEPFDPVTQPVPEDGLPPLPPTGEPFDPIDWDYLRRVRADFLDDIIDHYYRAEMHGADKIPATGPLIIAPNHSGTAFPHDGMIMDGLLWRHDGYRREAKFRSVFSPKLAAVWWMRPYGIDNWWRRGGGVDMTFKNYDALLARGDKVIYYPEGVPGIGKGFLKKYQLQHYYSSFVVLAARHGAPVYPVSIVNAEYVNPTGLTFAPLNKLFDKLLGIPFFPLPIMLLVLIFPFFFYFAFPCQMVFLIGDPLDIQKMLREEGCADPTQPTREAAQRVAERVRQIAQESLDAGVAQYGQKPYDWKGFWRSMKQVKGRRWRTSAFGWPFVFSRNARDTERPPAKNRLHAWLRDLDLWAYYVPFGWLLLVFFRAFRKPPYGYRGLSAEERRRREGSYRWDLTTRPLPPKEEGVDDDPLLSRERK